MTSVTFIPQSNILLNDLEMEPVFTTYFNGSFDRHIYIYIRTCYYLESFHNNHHRHLHEGKSKNFNSVIAILSPAKFRWHRSQHCIAELNLFGIKGLHNELTLCNCYRDIFTA